jgi:ribonuclease T2
MKRAQILLYLVLSYLSYISYADQGLIYVFAYSWKPGYCYTTNPEYPGCLEPKEYWKYNLTIHGLWPQYNTSGYPSYCSNEPFDENIPYEIGWDTMTTYFPDVNYDESSSDYDSFWDHEWTKHGTCSGLSQYDFFLQTINLSKKYVTPDIIDKYMNTTDQLSTELLRGSFGGDSYVALQCTNNIFTEVYTCWTTSTFLQIPCPESVQSEDSCNSEYLSILSL